MFLKTNQSKNEFDAWENEDYTWKSKQFSSWEAPSRILYAHQFRPIIHDKKTELVQRTLNIINNEVSEEFKNKLVSWMYFSHSFQC
jgi:hypothetical protein